MQSVPQPMSGSERCLSLDVNTFLAKFTKSLTWLQFDWPGSQACPHYTYREKGDELCAAGPKPKGVSQAPALALDKAQCINSFPGYSCANRSGSLGLSTKDTHPGFPGGSRDATCLTPLSHYSLLSLGDNSLNWMDEGMRRMSDQSFSGVTISGSR